MLAFERGLTAKLRREFRRVGKSAAAHAHGGHVDVEPLTRAHEHNLTAILRPYYLAAYKTFAKMVREHAPKMRSVKDLTEEDVDQLAIDFTNEWVPKRVKDISKTTANKIVSALDEARQNELTDSQTADLIVEKTGGKIGDSRAATIARTESHGASMAGSMQAASDLNIPGMKKVWITVQDDRVRDDHAEIDGDEEDIADYFQVGDDELFFPGDPSGSPEEVINCRCVLTYTTG